MITSTLKGRAAQTAAGIAAAALVAGSSLIGGSPAGADPKQFSALVGVGSDTVQDVGNAMAGFTNNLNYVPLQSSAASGARQLASFDATPQPSCITTKAGGPAFLRPDGSTSGRAALSRAIDGAVWPTATADCGGPKAVNGFIDYARSSAGPSGSGTNLTYIPFGRDGVSFAFYRSGGAPVTSLTSAELTSIFKGTLTSVGGVPVAPCGLQTGSGTYKFWIGAIGVTAGEEATGTAACNAAGTAGRIQENDATALKAKGDAMAAGTQVIVEFSAAQFISQSNGAAASTLTGTGVDLGAIDALGQPYTGTGPLAPSTGFYGSATYGRNVYNVVPTAKVTGLPSANADFKTMFVGTTSAVCSATSTITTFGFLSLGANCGTITTQGPLVANPF